MARVDLTADGDGYYRYGHGMSAAPTVSTNGSSRDWMARTGHAADAIARSGDIGKRITETDRPDPVGSLAATFNHMLEGARGVVQPRAETPLKLNPSKRLARPDRALVRAADVQPL